MPHPGVVEIKNLCDPRLCPFFGRKVHTDYGGFMVGVVEIVSFREEQIGNPQISQQDGCAKSLFLDINRIQTIGIPFAGCNVLKIGRNGFCDWIYPMQSRQRRIPRVSISCGRLGQVLCSAAAISADKGR